MRINSVTPCTFQDNMRLRYMRINIVVQAKQEAADTKKIESLNGVLGFYKIPNVGHAQLV